MTEPELTAGQLNRRQFDESEKRTTVLLASALPVKGLELSIERPESQRGGCYPKVCYWLDANDSSKYPPEVVAALSECRALLLDAETAARARLETEFASL